MWVHLAEGCQSLRTALEHNVLWSDKEKTWFAPYYMDDEKRWVDPIADGRKYCMNHVMPRWLLKSPAINEYADRENISLVAKLWANQETAGYLAARGADRNSSLVGPSLWAGDKSPS